MRIVTWNIEWLDHSWGVLEGRYTAGKRRSNRTLPSLAKAKLHVDAVVAELEALSADVFQLCEAPAGESAMHSFVASRLPGYELVTRAAGSPYETTGDQWIWFLVKKSLFAAWQPSLLDIATWRSFASLASPSIAVNGRWGVSLPRLTKVGEIKDVPVATRVSHKFARHPQTLRLLIDGMPLELIGAHLKSKFTGSTPRKRKPDEPFDQYAKEPRVARYLADSHAARIKLSSEALNLRAYIDHRFSQDADPAVIVLGDLNDGPGKELMEREYLVHDLISNLQGDVFFARRFLNHALFDQPQELRWTARFNDALEPNRDPHILLDHILLTQSLTRRGTFPLWAAPSAGKVEHRVHEEIEAAHGTGVASDHRPVSLTLTPRT